MTLTSHFVPMKRKGDASNALAELFEDKGVPTHLHTDGAKELTEGRWKEIRTQYGAINKPWPTPTVPGRTVLNLPFVSTRSR